MNVDLTYSQRIIRSSFSCFSCWVVLNSPADIAAKTQLWRQIQVKFALHSHVQGVWTGLYILFDSTIIWKYSFLISYKKKSNNKTHRFSGNYNTRRSLVGASWCFCLIINTQSRSVPLLWLYMHTERFLHLYITHCTNHMWKLLAN